VAKVGKAVTKHKPFNFHEDWIKAYQKLGGVEALVAFGRDPQNHKKFMDMGVALTPKNVKVEQEHTLNFVMVPPKTEVPEMPEEIIETFDAEFEEVNVNSGDGQQEE
tara:strand:- start:13107 stop:13427 length:321 start_codon:yes stop_codon:yes gene_type:complete